MFSQASGLTRSVERLRRLWIFHQVFCEASGARNVTAWRGVALRQGATARDDLFRNLTRLRGGSFGPACRTGVVQGHSSSASMIFHSWTPAAQLGWSFTARRSFLTPTGVKFTSHHLSLPTG